MRKLRYDAISYVLEHGNAFNRLKLAYIMGKKRDYQPLVDDLLSMQNEDGGWPWQLEEGTPSGVSDTPKVLELLAEVGIRAYLQPYQESSIISPGSSERGWRLVGKPRAGGDNPERVDLDQHDAQRLTDSRRGERPL